MSVLLSIPGTAARREQIAAQLQNRLRNFAIAEEAVHEAVIALRARRRD
jgi:predicted RNA polymerase sigma factor